MLGFCVVQCAFTASSRVKMFTRIIYIYFPPRKKDKWSVIKKVNFIPRGLNNIEGKL